MDAISIDGIQQRRLEIKYTGIKLGWLADDFNQFYLYLFIHSIIIACEILIYNPVLKE